jgi:hypothetical protein
VIVDGRGSSFCSHFVVGFSHGVVGGFFAIRAFKVFWQISIPRKPHTFFAIYAGDAGCIGLDAVAFAVYFSHELKVNGP